MLKKLFFPEVQDICPNCGEACAFTDVLCPQCGKNLDELFEQLPNPQATYERNRIAKILRNPLVIKGWYITNSITLVVSLLTPWIILYSDVFGGWIPFRSESGFRVLLSPILVLKAWQNFSIAEFLPSFGWHLVWALAPAIAIYYSIYGIRTVLNMKKEMNIPILEYTPAVLRLLFAGISFALIGFGVGIDSRFYSSVSFGYFLAIIGLSSAFFLELIVPVLSKEQSKRKAA